MNGRPVGSLIKRHCAYVPQEDTFVPTLSARETLQVAPCRLSGGALLLPVGWRPAACRVPAGIPAGPVLCSLHALVSGLR